MHLVLLVGRERARLSSALAADARARLRRHGVRREHRLGDVHGGARDRQRGRRRPRRSSSEAAQMVRRRRNPGRRNGACHARDALGAPTRLHAPLSFASAIARSHDAGQIRRRVRSAHRSHCVDGRHASARREVVAISRRHTRPPYRRALRDERGRGNLRHDGGRPLPDSGARNPRHISAHRRREPGGGSREPVACRTFTGPHRRNGGGRHPKRVARRSGSPHRAH